MDAQGYYSNQSWSLPIWLLRIHRWARRWGSLCLSPWVLVVGILVGVLRGGIGGLGLGRTFCFFVFLALRRR